MFYESNDLIIRPYRQGDEPSLAFYSNNRLIAAQMQSWFPSPFTYDDALVWVADNLQSNSNFPIIYYGDVIGNIGLRNISGDSAEIVVWIGPDLASGSPSIWLLCPFNIFPLFFEYFLSF